jgi:hypothetical protein
VSALMRRWPWTISLVHVPATFRYATPPANHRPPGAWRQGRAASMNSRVNRCTHRYTLTWSTVMPRSASNSSTSR